MHALKRRAHVLGLLAAFYGGTTTAQSTSAPSDVRPEPAVQASPPVLTPEVTAPASTATELPKKEKPWWERFALRGYTQVRYNRLAATNDRLVNPQGDRSLGPDGGFLIRRARLIFSGDPHRHLSFYLQPDFASVIGEQHHVTILRDWYADIFVDATREFRFRVGQSKVPYGFENMQSSSQRLPFDRSDALNSALKDERDLGVFFYWAPSQIRKRFKLLVDEGEKGSGDYGVLALGIYNGQTANRPETSGNRHVVGRISWPFELGGQMLEVGAGGYAGRFTVARSSGVTGPDSFRDLRAHASVVLYPRPFGFQAEYNVGVGPERVGATIEERPLHGGYALASLKLGNVIPFARFVIYDGAKKFETNAPPYHVRELETGVEWTVFNALELTFAVLLARRSSPDSPYQVESGRRVRLQAQFNY